MHGTETLEAAPASAERDLAERDLAGANLAGANLAGADLAGKSLAGANLLKADLKRARLAGATLEGAELAGADLEGADLADVQAARAGFGHANLAGAHLFGADLEGATLSGAVLARADLRAARLGGARLREADLSGADLTRASLRGADLSHANVGRATFDDADLRESRLQGVTGWDSARWIGVDLRDVNFTGAYRLRRFAIDQNYIQEFRESSRFAEILYRLWWLTSDCGRSLTRWCACIAVAVFAFAALYTRVGVDFGPHAPGWLSAVYYSVVTLTTLGYGEIVPASRAGQLVAIAEVTTGYVMLGGLLSIFANKLARRGD